MFYYVCTDINLFSLRVYEKEEHNAIQIWNNIKNLDVTEMKVVTVARTKPW